MTPSALGFVEAATPMRVSAQHLADGMANKTITSNASVCFATGKLADSRRHDRALCKTLTPYPHILILSEPVVMESAKRTRISNPGVTDVSSHDEAAQIGSAVAYDFTFTLPLFMGRQGAIISLVTETPLMRVPLATIVAAGAPPPPWYG